MARHERGGGSERSNEYGRSCAGNRELTEFVQRDRADAIVLRREGDRQLTSAFRAAVRARRARTEACQSTVVNVSRLSARLGAPAKRSSLAAGYLSCRL